MAMKAKHAFGSEKDISKALADGKIDAFDILFLDEKKVGWVTKNGDVVIAEPDLSEVEAEIAKKASAEDVEALEKEVATKATAEDIQAVENAIATKADAEKVESLEEQVAAKADAAEVETALASKADAEKVETLETELANKVSAEEVDAKVETAVAEKVESTISEMEFEVDVDYEISHKPDGTLVDYRDKEIRVMIPTDTQFELQNSGENADANAYYIGFKAYAPDESVVNFKEDLAETIADETMYSFEGNEFAGIDEDGRKYSIVWLPVAMYDGSAWIYYGANSVKGKYIGWYYSVEWYDANGKIVASDCIRISLSNENCHSEIKPYYMSDMMTEVETLVNEKIKEIESGNEIIEF